MQGALGHRLRREVIGIVRYVIPISCLVRARSAAEASAQRGAAQSLLGAPFVPGLAQSKGVPLEGFQLANPEAFQGFWNIPLYAFVSLTSDREAGAIRAKIEALVKEPMLMALLKSKHVDVVSFTVGPAERVPAAAGGR